MSEPRIFCDECKHIHGKWSCPSGAAMMMRTMTYNAKHLEMERLDALALKLNISKTEALRRAVRLLDAIQDKKVFVVDADGQSREIVIV